jgi:hypothetical protein
MHHVNAITIDDRTRVVVEYDLDAGDDCPLEWQGAGYVSIRNAYHGSPFTVDPAETADTVRHIVDQLDGARGDVEGAIETAIVKHYARQGYVAARLDLRGSSQSDWHDGYVYVIRENAEWLEGMGETLQQWYEGAVYVLTLQRLETWTNEAGETRDTWESHDSMGGVYVDAWDDAAVLAEAMQHFELTPA